MIEIYKSACELCFFEIENYLTFSSDWFVIDRRQTLQLHFVIRGKHQHPDSFVLSSSQHPTTHKRIFKTINLVTCYLTILLTRTREMTSPAVTESVLKLMPVSSFPENKR